ncbi:MAG: ATP-binding protein [Candidatus Eisenbacteria bacterium]|nr:ATP-binding protein [Candidatus Eisenbacteria bacterium]
MLSLSPVNLIFLSLGVAVLLIFAGWIVSALRMPFRIKLTLVVAIVALFPYLSLAFLLSRELTRSVNMWETPGVGQGLRSSLDIARQSIEDKQAALELEFRKWWSGSDAEKALRSARGGRIVESLRASGKFDFAGVYGRNNRGSWEPLGLWQKGTGKQPQIAGVEIDSLLSGKIPAIASDSTVMAARLEPGPGRDRGRAVIAGRFLDDADILRAKNLVAAIRVYDQLNIYKELSKRVVWIFFALSAVLALLLAALIGSHVSGRLTGPLRLLSAEMRRVGSGSFTGEMAITSRDEVGELVQSFNKMAKDLRQYERDLKRTERIAAWKDVARRIAHEIKNPLTPIRFSLQRIASRADLPDKKESSEIGKEVQAILGQLVTLESMASSFSSFAKLPEPKLEPFQIESLLVDILKAAEKQDVRVEYEGPAALPAINVDPTLMRVVFNNIVKNAHEAMPEGGKLNVATEVVGGKGGQDGEGYLAIRFTDTGKGIPDEILEKIWNPYFTTKTDGTGLGLSICLKIVGEHRGRMEITSKVGEGTAVLVLLPLAETGRMENGV